MSLRHMSSLSHRDWSFSSSALRASDRSSISPYQRINSGISWMTLPASPRFTCTIDFQVVYSLLFALESHTGRKLVILSMHHANQGASLPRNAPGPHSKSETKQKNFGGFTLKDPKASFEFARNILTNSSSKLRNASGPHSKSEAKEKFGSLTRPLEDSKLYFDFARNILENSSSESTQLQQSLNGLAEASKVLMGALDMVSQAHPAIAAAVIAFKSVMGLELTRRSNNQKVKVLWFRVADMMSVFLNLRDMQVRETLQSGWQAMLQKVADDINDCGNACDAYRSISFTARFLKSPIWDTRFSELAARFDASRREIQFHLGVHTANMVSEIRDGVQNVEKRLGELFNRVESQFEKEFAKLVNSRGGREACMGDDATLRELATLAENKNISLVRESARNSKPAKPVMNTADPVLSELKEELEKNVNTYLEEHRERFEHKLELLGEQLTKATDQLTNVVKREGDLVIKAVTSGPHERVKNEELRKLWKEMGWKGSVDAHHFILALHDHFNEKNEKFRVLEGDYSKNSSQDPSSASGKYESLGKTIARTTVTSLQKKQLDEWRADRWAYTYINILRIWSLREEIDDDSTGFVTIKEVNIFSSSRPEVWSLPQWMAYWAAGWHFTVWSYRSKIIRIIKEMWDILDEVHPSNRRVVDRYLGSKAFRRIDLLLRSVNPCHNEDDYNLMKKISPYVEGEENRLKRNLVSIQYDIDTLDTLSLITGPGRIERYVFPLLYLVLQRHLQIIKIARTKFLSIFELYRPRDLPLIFESVDERINILTVVFKQQNVDVTAQLDSFAFGMFKFLHDPPSAEVPDEEGPGIGNGDDDNTDVDDPDASQAESPPDVKLLKFPFRDEELDYATYDTPVQEAVSTALGEFSGIKGVWTGVYFSEESRPERLMKMAIHDSADEGTLSGSGKDGSFTFTISGRIKHSDNGDMAVVEFTKQYHPLHDRKKSSVYHWGNFDSSAKTIIGKWGASADSEFAGEFRLGRYPAFAHPFRYSKDELVKNPARARWSFAGAAIRYQVRQRLGLLSWTFLKVKGMNKRRLLELYRRRERFKAARTNPGDELTKGETAELKALEESNPADARFYRSVAISEVRRMCIHFNAKCDVCSARIVGSRIICLVCVATGYTDEINLCATCIDLPITRGDFIHDATHDIVKISGRIVHDKEKPSLIRSAREAIESKLSNGASEPEGHLDQLDEDSGSVQSESIGPERCCSCCPEPESLKLVSLPCWFCVRCAVFICDHCEETKAACSNEDHKKEHPLVRVRYDQYARNLISMEIRSFEARVESNQTKLSDRLDHLEKGLHDHEGYMNGRFGSLESKVEPLEGRLARVEGILLQVASKFGEDRGPERQAGE